MLGFLFTNHYGMLLPQSNILKCKISTNSNKCIYLTNLIHLTNDK